MNNMKYVNDSLAHDYDLFAEKPKSRDNIIDMRDRKPVENKKQSSFLSKAVTLGLLSVIVVSIFVNIFIRAQISEVSNQINETEKTVNELKSEETRLNVLLEKKTTFANLEKQAKSIGMQKQEKMQMNYIFLYEDGENDKESAEAE